MDKLPNNPSKATEIAYYNEFVGNLPTDTYLRSILAGTTSAVGGMIANDLAFTLDVRQIERDASEAKETLTLLTKQIREAEGKLRDLEARQRKAEGHLQEMRDTARYVADRVAASV